MNKPREAPIGVFDSGIGGLTVAREIMRQIPQERIVYFGDTARLPYGSKSRNTIIRYSRQIVRFLRTRQVKAIGWTMAFMQNIKSKKLELFVL